MTNFRSKVVILATTLVFSATAASAAIIHGTAGNDQMVGTPYNDGIYGYAGCDNIFAGAGADNVHSGQGCDTARGEEGADEVYGQDGADVVKGGNGNDTVDIGGEDWSDAQEDGFVEQAYDGPGADFIDTRDGEGNDTWYQCADGTTDTWVSDPGDANTGASSAYC